MNKQRQAVYGLRRQLLEGEDQKERILEIVEGIVGSLHRPALPREGAPRRLGSGSACEPTSSPSSA